MNQLELNGKGVQISVTPQTDGTLRFIVNGFKHLPEGATLLVFYINKEDVAPLAAFLRGLTS